MPLFAAAGGAEGVTLFHFIISTFFFENFVFLKSFAPTFNISPAPQGRSRAHRFDNLKQLLFKKKEKKVISPATLGPTLHRSCTVSLSFSSSSSTSTSPHPIPFFGIFQENEERESKFGLRGMKRGRVCDDSSLSALWSSTLMTRGTEHISLAAKTTGRGGSGSGREAWCSRRSYRS